MAECYGYANFIDYLDYHFEKIVLEVGLLFQRTVENESTVGFEYYSVRAIFDNSGVRNLVIYYKL